MRSTATPSREFAAKGFLRTLAAALSGNATGPIPAGDGGLVFREVSRSTGLTETQVSALAVKIGLWPWRPNEIEKACSLAARKRRDDELARDRE